MTPRQCRTIKSRYLPPENPRPVIKIPGLPRFAGELSSLLFFFDYVAANFLLGRDVSEVNSLPKDSLGIKHDWHIEQISARFPMRGPL